MADPRGPEDVPADDVLTGELAALARSLTAEDFTLEEPPPHVWANIATKVSTSGPTPRTQVHRRRSTNRSSRPGGRGGLRRPVLVGSVAAAVLAVLVVATVAISVSSGPSRPVRAEVALSNAGLDGAGRSSGGNARLVDQDGTAVIELDLRGLPAESNGYLELWLIDTEVQGMVSLGPLHGNGAYPVPANVVVGDFPVLDISLEPIDGQPTHSGRSVLRGVLAV